MKRLRLSTTTLKFTLASVRVLISISLIFLLVVMLIPGTNVYAAPFLHENYDHSPHNFWWTPRPPFLLGQTFTAISDHTVTSVRFQLWAQGTPGIVYVHLMETDSGLPSGSYLATAERDTFSDGWQEWTFLSPYALTGGEEYALVIDAPDSGDSGNNINIWTENPGSYGYGQAVMKSGTGSWQGTTLDMDFQVYGGPGPIKMHELQDPDLVNGKDVGMWAPWKLADDFQCSESGWITDMHIWVSWLDDLSNDDPTPQSTFLLEIWEDIPADIQDPNSYSMPGGRLWNRVFDPGEYTVWPEIPTEPEDFVHPNPDEQGGEIIGTDNFIYQYDFLIDLPEAFFQEEGKIYWLSVLQWDGMNPGWKTSSIHFQDYAVYTSGTEGPWEELIYVTGEPMMLDFAFAITGYGADFGDAPVNYGTLIANNGASHTIGTGNTLGTFVDAEPDGQPSSLADGDDLNPVGAADDEDGVTLPPLLTAGDSAAAVTVHGGTAGGMLDAWIDFDINGVFDHPAEHLFGVSTLVNPGNNPLAFSVPSNATAGTAYARFRLSENGGLLPTGLAPDGEVEDYQVEIERPPSTPLPPSQPQSGATVGGDIYPVDKVALLMPWIAVGALLLAGGIFLIRRRVGTQLK